MAPLIVLIGSFVIVFTANKLLFGGTLSTSLIGRISMSAMLIVTGTAHFTNTDLLVEMMPDAMPIKHELVYFTGVCELAAAVGLLWDKTRKLASILLIVFFLTVLPANIAGSIKQVNFGGMEYGVVYLLFRVPLQLLFIWWIYYFGIRIYKPAPLTG